MIKINIDDENNIVPEHEAKDRILQFLVSKMPETDFDVETIHKNTFPSQDKVITQQLLIHIYQANSNLLITTGSDWRLNNFLVWFTATELTRQFLDSGGFTKRHNDNLLEERERYIRELLEEKTLHDSIETNRSTRINYRINVILSIAAILISLIALITSITNEK